MNDLLQVFSYRHRIAAHREPNWMLAQYVVLRYDSHTTAYTLQI